MRRTTLALALLMGALLASPAHGQDENRRPNKIGRQIERVGRQIAALDKRVDRLPRKILKQVDASGTNGSGESGNLERNTTAVIATLISVTLALLGIIVYGATARVTVAIEEEP